MFSRKKDKKRKPGMTQAEIAKLEEVGIRRGFFGKKVLKRDKEEGIQKQDISRPLSVQLTTGDEKTEVEFLKSVASFQLLSKNSYQQLPSVLQRATMYGQVISGTRKLSASSISSQPALHSVSDNSARSTDDSGTPVAPLRRKASTKSVQEYPYYDVPKPSVNPSIPESYTVPKAPNQSFKEAHRTSNRYAVPRLAHRSSKRTVRHHFSILAELQPDALPAQVVLKKKDSGDFGLSLRRSAMIEIVDGKEVKRTIYFAEPGLSMQSSVDDNDDDDSSSRLYPGDRLIEIDGVNVENSSRDDIVARIKSAGSQVTLLVHSLNTKNVQEIASSNRPQESRYSTPRKPEPAVRTGIKTVPSLISQTQDDGTPKLPLPRKGSKVENSKPLTKTPTPRRKSLNNDVDFHANAGDQRSRTVDVVTREAAPQTSEVSPSELHASSISAEAASKPLQRETCSDDCLRKDEAAVEIENLKSLRMENESLSCLNPDDSGWVNDTDSGVDRTSRTSSMKNNEQRNNETHINGYFETEELLNFANAEFHKEPASKPDVVRVQKKPGVEWDRKEKIWYQTADGISEGHVVMPAGDADADPVPDGKSRIEVSESGDVLLVPEDNVEMANDVKFDREVDLCKLRHLNESSILHLLRQRFIGGLNFTHAGPHLLALRLPYDHSGNVQNFTEQTRLSYKDTRFGDSPPHLYHVAQHAYHDMMSTTTDQCLLSLGHTGSGKSVNVQHILSYYATVAAHSRSSLNVDKIAAVPVVLQSFSSAASSECLASSRCVHLYNLDFDRSGMLAALSVQALLLERSRLVRRSEKESNFNVFYQLLYGADTQLRRELFLLDMEQESNPLVLSSFNADPTFHQMAVNGFSALQKSFESLSFAPNEIKGIHIVLAACLHLGLAGAQQIDGAKYQFVKADSAQKAASLLGVSFEYLSKTIFQPVPAGNRMRSASSASLKRSNSSLSSASNFSVQSGDSKMTGQQALDSFIVSLYAEVFRSVISLVNRALSSSVRAQNTIVVVDAPGYQGVAGRSRVAASYSDLTFNYVQDRIHAIFYHNAFSVYKDRYQQESIDCEVSFPDSNPSLSVDAVDLPPSLGVSGVKGLFWILDEEAASPGATDESFIERLLLHHGKSQSHKAPPIVQRSPNKGCFIVRHQGGTVEYDATGWLAYAIYNSTLSTVSDILLESKKAYIAQLFGSVGEKAHGSVAALKLDAGGSNLKRGSSFRKVWSSTTAAAAVKKSMCMTSKFQTDNLIDALRRASPHFVFCFSPVPASSDQVHQGLTVDVDFLRRQLRGSQLLDATRSLKQGYPEHVIFSEFRRRFDVLLRHLSSEQSSNSTSIALLDDKEATEKVLEHVEITRSQFRIGVSQVFFRAGVLNALEDKRNEKVSSVLTIFQAHCRGYLARKRFERKKVQVVAVRCIQRNIRKFMAIRQWPWWRLLTKVLPLVEVTRTEEELREKQADLDLLKDKFEKAQSEKDELKQSNAKYEAKLHDLMLLLDEERNAASHASDLLEQERKERLRLEKLSKDLQSNYDEMREKIEVMEVELAEKRLLYSENIPLDSDDDEDGEYKIKYEKAHRDFNFQIKKKTQEHEDALEELRADKKSLERKLFQLQEELDDQQRLESQNKKKLHKLSAELSDAKIHLEETSAKNHDLEKKQRKFDSEVYAFQASITELKTARDRIQREKDRVLLEKNDVEKDLTEKLDDIETLELKIKRLEEELEDTDKKDSDDRHMVNGLKRQIRDLEAKLKDQEEELEEQASTIHTLEHAKERLEMSSEHARQQRQREVEGKEEEMEEMRSSYHKKIKQMEIQLEEADEERSSLSRQKRELEEQLKSVRDLELDRRDPDTEKRLRRDLKRYKALLSDAQTMVDHLKADAVSKQQMKQLKAEVDELQYTSAAAIKSRKAIELEVEDLQAQLDEVTKGKQDAESRVSALLRETHELQSKLDDEAEDAQETLRKYRSLVNQQSDDRRQLIELQTIIEEMKHEKNSLEDKILSLQNQVQFLETNTTDNAVVQRLESKVKDLETKLEFQKTTTKRLEVQLSRAKENVEKLSSERDAFVANEHREREATKRIQRQLRESKEEQGDLLKREQEALKKKHDLEMELSDHQNQIESLQADLKLAFKRISDLQASLEDVEESDFDSDDIASSISDDEFPPNRGWKNRFSTSGYSIRSKSVASSRTDQSQAVDDFSLLGGRNESRNSLQSSVYDHGRFFKEKRRSSNSSNKHDVLDSLPVEESMSSYGKKIADDVYSSVESMKRKRVSSASSSQDAPDTSREALCRPKPLDKMSRSLADEDPSLLLYGNPSRISLKLGLGKAKSFHALNETLHAVKHRQNLSDPRRMELRLRDKINHDIEAMKNPGSRRGARASDLIDDEEDAEVRTISSLSNRSYFDLDTSRPSSCVRRPRSTSSSRASSRCSDDSTTEGRPRSYLMSHLQSDTDLILRRHEKLMATNGKPFTSRFLNKVKKRKNIHDDATANSRFALSGYQSRNIEANHDGHYIESPLPCRSYSNPINLNDAKTKTRFSNQKGFAYLSDIEDYANQSEDDVSLSYYGIRQSPIETERASELRSRSSVGFYAQNRIKSRDSLVGNGNDDRFQYSDCESADEKNDLNFRLQSDPLDSIISKYLYRK